MPLVVSLRYLLSLSLPVYDPFSETRDLLLPVPPLADLAVLSGHLPFPRPEAQPG